MQVCLDENVNSLVYAYIITYIYKITLFMDGSFINCIAILSEIGRRGGGEHLIFIDKRNEIMNVCYCSSSFYSILVIVATPDWLLLCLVNQVCIWTELTLLIFDCRLSVLSCGMKIKSVRVGKHLICYGEKGQPKPEKSSILLVHGFSADMYMWVPLVRVSCLTTYLITLSLNDIHSTYVMLSYRIFFPRKCTYVQ